MKFKILTLFLFLSIAFSFAQETNEVEDQSLKGQFDKIYRTSTTYRPPDTKKRYKVINIESYDFLKANVLDSIDKANKEVADKIKQLNAERDKNNQLNTVLTKTKKELEIALENENSISFLGIPLSKTSYNFLLWSIIILLIGALATFIFKFTRSNVLTKKAQENLVDLEYEFETHRKKSLEREQKLRRQLQDEINKQRNSKS
ncbi:MAG: hypothetical protein HWD82_09735 [Flavobacteriaceae bacterium]|nr:hypothetical protein [Flavobacteriaceae bacterium]